MNVLYFDTETTGLRADYVVVDGNVYPGKICQLAYLINNDGQIRCKNFYFTVQAIDPAASAVTGLTVPLLQQLSQGREFADDIEEIAADFAGADLLVAHNLLFDERFMRAEFARLGYCFEVGNRGRCTMRTFAPVLQLPSVRAQFKYPSLQEFATAYGVDNAMVMRYMAQWFDVQKEAHDARHDVVKMYLAVQHACQAVPAMAPYFGR